MFHIGNLFLALLFPSHRIVGSFKNKRLRTRKALACEYWFVIVQNINVSHYRFLVSNCWLQLYQVDQCITQQKDKDVHLTKWKNHSTITDSLALDWGLTALALNSMAVNEISDSERPWTDTGPNPGSVPLPPPTNVATKQGLILVNNFYCVQQWDSTKLNVDTNA